MSFISKLFGGDSSPPVSDPIMPPTTADAMPAADVARRAQAGKGRGATILTSELGVSDTASTPQKKLLGIG